MNRAKRIGFTLLEVFVGIATLAMLTVVLSPVVMQARASAWLGSHLDRLH